MTEFTARLFYTDHYLITLPEAHKFPVKKYGLVRSLLQQDRRFHFEPAPPAAVEALELVHEPSYVREFLSGGLPPAAMRRIGLPWSETLAKRSLASVGGTMAAAQDALRAGWGGTLGGGTHHAFRAEGSGFCVFNDIAVAIRSLMHQGRIHRAAVIDLDVHQGDGTAEIFRHEPNVFTLSIHCQSNFPFRKQQSRLDIALPDRISDEQYLQRLDEALPQVLAFGPDVIFYQSGVDGLHCDALGRLSLTHAGLKERDRRVMESVRDADIPLVITSGGGHSRPIGPSVQAHATTYRMAWQTFCGARSNVAAARSQANALPESPA
jgi:acetoin utilization deacetylase AcuC-like enzyme